jgi:hypothetical protein
MAELDKIPQKQSIEIETVKIDEDTYKSIQDLNSEIGQFVGRFGEIYLRKKEIQEELIRLDDILEQSDEEFKGLNLQLKDMMDALDEQYPQGRLNMKEGTIQYQPGAPTRKQLMEQQQQQQQ